MRPCAVAHLYFFGSAAWVCCVLGISRTKDARPVGAQRARARRKSSGNVSSEVLHAIATEGNQDGIIYSSWVTLGLLYEELPTHEQMRFLATALRNALADSLEVCRPSVKVVEMHAVGDDLVLRGPVESSTTLSDSISSQVLHRVRAVLTGLSFLESVFSAAGEPGSKRTGGEAASVNSTHIAQVKAVYRVHAFSGVRLSPAEVSHRMNRLQVGASFLALGRLLTSSLEATGFPVPENVLIDDVGSASRHRPQPRSALTQHDMANCFEENALQDARANHKYAMGLCFVQVLLLLSVGSLMFNAQGPSTVPSRLNPLASHGIS